MKKIILKLVKFISRAILKPVSYILKKNNLIIIGRDGSAIGDHLIMTSVIDYICDKSKNKVIVITNHPYIFENNPNIKKIINYKNLNYFLKKLTISLLYFSNKNNFIFFRFHKINNLSMEDYMKRTQKKMGKFKMS